MPPEQQAQQSSPEEMVMSVQNGLSQLLEMVSQAEGGEEAAQELSQILEAFRSFIQKLEGGGQSQGQQQPVPSDQGARQAQPAAF